jgi:hypothetical protein
MSVVLSTLCSCDKFKVNSKELNIMEGKWKVSKHHYTFYFGSDNVVVCDTILEETGSFEFHRTNDDGGTFSFSPVSDHRPVAQGYKIAAMSGTFQLTDLKSNIDMMLNPEGGGMAYKHIKIIDFGKKSQVWYADRSLNLESGASETIYLEKE